MGVELHGAERVLRPGAVHDPVVVQVALGTQRTAHWVVCIITQTTTPSQLSSESEQVRTNSTGSTLLLRGTRAGWGKVKLQPPHLFTPTQELRSGSNLKVFRTVYKPQLKVRGEVSSRVSMATLVSKQLNVG